MCVNGRVVSASGELSGVFVVSCYQQLGLGPWTMAINMAISTKYGPFMALFSPKYGS